ncbi:hypothetical protein DFS34DRAFT_468416 [Phlyctochytrium arcticum]|nr:hypothetical protein DFS34DRAFT_468416 [Phlyctochytrium arcticum]
MNRAATLHRATSLTSTDQEANEGMSELELQKLQRQYRIMEGDRKAYSEESRLLIAKQRGTIDKLKRENQYLVNELALLEQRTDDRRRAGLQTKKAEEMAEQADSYNKRIKALLMETAELDNALGLLDRDIDQQRAQLGGVNAAYENSEAIGKQIGVLENRLDKALIKFNKSLAVNKRMRAVIDNLRRERLVFDNIYRKFERELAEQKKTMADIIEASNSAYEARDEAQARIIALREKAEKEHQAYVQEVKELDRSLEQDRRLKEFMATKVADRHPPEEPGAALASTQVPEGGRKSDTKKEKPAPKPRFGSQETLIDSLESYDTAFALIQKETGVSSIKDLVRRMKTVEDENFSLFNYVNEVNNDIEQLAEEIVEIQRKIDSMKVGHVKEEESMNKVLKGLEAQLNSCTEKHAAYEKQFADTVYVITDLRRGIERVVEKLNDKAFLPPPVTKPAAPASTTSTAHPASAAPTAAAAAKPEEGAETAESAEGGPEDEELRRETGEEATSEEPIVRQAAEESARSGSIHALNAGSKNNLTKQQAPQQDQQPPQSSPNQSTEPADAYLGTGTVPSATSGPVTDSNLLSFLGLIEQKTNDLLTLNYLLNAPKKSGSAAASGAAAGGEDGATGGPPGSAGPNGPAGGAPGTPAGHAASGGVSMATGLSTSQPGGMIGPLVGGLLGHGPNAPIGNITIIPPSTGDDHDDDLISDDDDRPLTREELERRTLRGLSRREKQAGATKGTGGKHKRKGGGKKVASVPE